MKTLIKPLVAFIAVIMAGVLPLCAQSVATAVSEAPVVEDSLANASSGIVERLQASESGVHVDAPDALWLRALPRPVADSADGGAEDAVEEQSQERVVRTKSGKIVGYRVQVYADNNVRNAKTEARRRERAVGDAFPSFGTYVSYASPYWRLRVGDFRSQYDAEKAAAEIRKAFPRYAREVRVVRDRINSR